DGRFGGRGGVVPCVVVGPRPGRRRVGAEERGVVVGADTGGAGGGRVGAEQRGVERVVAVGRRREPDDRVRRGVPAEERVVEAGGLGTVGRHGCAQELAATRSPANRSVSYSPSGVPGSTNVRARTYSSHGWRSCVTSSGTRKKKLSLGTCVWCASSASRATS